jgi:hypothetical protein
MKLQPPGTGPPQPHGSPPGRPACTPVASGGHESHDSGGARVGRDADGDQGATVEIAFQTTAGAAAPGVQ